MTRAKPAPESADPVPGDPFAAATEGLTAASGPTNESAIDDALKQLEHSIPAPDVKDDAPRVEPPKRGRPKGGGASRFYARLGKDDLVQRGKALEDEMRRVQEENDRLKATTAPDAANAEKELGDALAVAFQISFTVLAVKRGPHWAMTKEETAALGEAWAKPLAPYLVLGGPWVGALVVTVAVVMPRAMEDSRIHAERAKARAAAAGSSEFTATGEEIK